MSAENMQLLEERRSSLTKIKDFLMGILCIPSYFLIQEGSCRYYDYSPMSEPLDEGMIIHELRGFSKTTPSSPKLKSGL